MKVKSVLLSMAIVVCWASLSIAASVTISSMANEVTATRTTLGNAGYVDYTDSQTGNGDVYATSPFTSSEAAGASAAVESGVLSVGHWYTDASPCKLYALARGQWTFTAAASSLLMDIELQGAGGTMYGVDYYRIAAWGVSLAEAGTSNPVTILSGETISLSPDVDDIWNGAATLNIGVQYTLTIWLELQGFTEGSVERGYILTPTLEYGDQPQQTVPEPATLLLLGLGLAGLAGVRKKIQK